MEKLRYPTPVKDLTTGYLIDVTHSRLIIGADFELTQEVRLEYYTDDDGALGLPIAEAIRLNPNISEDQKRRLTQVFKPVTRTTSTAGYFVDAESLEYVTLDENGDLPANAIPERLLWVNVLAEDVPGEKLSDKVKALLLQSMGQMISRGRI